MMEPDQQTHDYERASLEPSSAPAEKLRQIRSGYWAWGAVVALAVLLWLPRLSGPIDLRWDGGVYYLLGTSLATGHGYRIPSEPGLPEAVQYPPVLPAIVAVHQWTLGTTDAKIVAPWLRVFYAILFLLFAIATLALARKYLPLWFAVAATALCLVQVMTVFLSDLLFTELPFALITTLFVLLAQKGAPQRRRVLRETGLFILAATAFLLRTAGIALLVTWVLDALIRRHWRLALLRLALAAIPIVSWQSYIAGVRGSSDYTHPAYAYQRAPYQYSNVSYAENAALVDPFRPELGRLNTKTLATRLTSNVRSVLLALGESVSARKGEWDRLLGKVTRRFTRHRIVASAIYTLVIVPLTGLVLFGLFVLLRRRAWIMLLTVITSLGLIWTTPWPVQFNRYLMPLGSLLAISAVLALSEIDNALRRRRANLTLPLNRLAVPGVLVLMLAVESFATLRLFRQRASPEGLSTAASKTGRYRLFAYSHAWQDWEKAADWIKPHTPANAIVATMPSHFCYLLTGRLSIIPPMDLNGSRERELLAAVPVSYVIIDRIEFPDLARRYALPAVRDDPAGWQVVYSVGGTSVYQHITTPPVSTGSTN